MNVPQLNLSLGQVLWSINLGDEPPIYMVDKVNYLRKLGIPDNAAIARLGSGNRGEYCFEDLIEIGVAYHALINGMKPKDISSAIVMSREEMHGIYRKALLEQPEKCIDAEWVSSKGRIGAVLENAIFLRLHDRYSSTPNLVEAVSQEPSSLFGMLEKHVNYVVRNFPLTNYLIQWVYWAQRAPIFKTGPK